MNEILRTISLKPEISTGLNLKPEPDIYSWSWVKPESQIYWV